MKKGTLSILAALFLALSALPGTALAADTAAAVIAGPEEDIRIGEAFDIAVGEEVMLPDYTMLSIYNMEDIGQVEVTARLGMAAETAVPGELTFDDETGEIRITVDADDSCTLFGASGRWTIQASFTASLILESDEEYAAVCQITSNEIPVNVTGGKQTVPQLSAGSVRFCAVEGEEYALITVHCMDGHSFSEEVRSSSQWAVRLAGTGLTLRQIECDGAGSSTAVIRLDGSAAVGSSLEIQALPAAFVSSNTASGSLTLTIPERNAVPLHPAFLMEGDTPAGLTWQLTASQGMSVPEKFQLMIVGSKGNAVYETVVNRGGDALSITETGGSYTCVCRLPDWDLEALPADTYTAVIMCSDSESRGGSWTKVIVDGPVSSDDASSQLGAAGRDPAGGTAEAVPNGLIGTVSGSAGQVTAPGASSGGPAAALSGGSASAAVAGPGGQVMVTLSASAVSEAQSSGRAAVLPMPAVCLTAGAPAPLVVVTTGSARPVKVEIPAENTTPGTVAVLVHPDGREEVIRTSIATDTGVVAVLSDGDAVRIVDNSEHFSDAEGHWANSAISFVSAHELFSGTGEGRFTPDAGMTRAMVVTVLARYDGVDTSGGATWYEKGAAWAMEHGISSGVDLEGPVSREQLAAMLFRYAAITGENTAIRGDMTVFSDADSISGYAAEAVSWAVGAGLLGGTDKGTLAPLDGATRAEVAAILMRFCAFAAQ